ncbi:MAG: hypothetical protein P1U56_17385 [Saprospiraceae bacterium]|nr:hypothetical protein [Saprospiraceae bacterium]
MKKLVCFESLYLITFILGITLLFNGCSKEEFSVVDVPFEELESSYYILADQTIEVTDDRYDELVLSKQGEVLNLKDDPLFDNLKVGSIIVSSLDVAEDRLLFREIVAINSSGSTIETITKPANIVKAFKEYYFNSEFSNLISVRSDYDIKAIFDVADNVLDLLAKAFIPIPFDPNFALSGKPTFEAIHPHVAYKYFGCDNPPNCLQGIDTTDIMPRNGYYDVVERFFTGLDKDINKNGLFTFTLKDFRIETLSASVSIGEALTSEYPYGDPQAVFNLFAQQQVDNIGSYFPSDLKLKYFPIGSFFGIVNIAAVIGPEFGGFAKSASAYFEVNATFPNKADLKMGHLNWNTTSDPNFDFDIQLLQQLPNNKTKVVSYSYLIEDGQVNATLGAKGEVGYSFGIGVGAALAFGEPNYAGEALGALADVSAYVNFNGHIGVNFTDLFTVGGGTADPFGNICFDTGVKFGAKFFFDENVVGTVFEELFQLDVVIPIPDDLLPIKKFSFLKYFEGYTDDGLCLGSDGCAVTSQTYFNMGVTDQELGIEFKHTNNKIPNEKYEVELVAGSNKYKLSGEYEFGEAVNTFLSAGVLEVLEAYDAGTLKINVIAPMLNCSKTFDQSEVGLYFPCPFGLFDSPSGTIPFVEFDDIALSLQYYFLKENSSKHCQSLGKKQMSKDAIIEKLNTACINPTGFLIANESTYIKVNSHQMYVWIPEEEDGKNILEIDLDATSSGNVIKATRTKISSKSIYAPCLCES